MKILLVVVLIVLILGMTRDPVSAGSIGTGLGHAASSLGDVFASFLSAVAQGQSAPH